MGGVISAVQFDILRIQFYNTSAQHAAGSALGLGSATDAWTTFLNGYIELPSSTSAVTNPAFYLNLAEALQLIKAYLCRSNFGGVMLWDATYVDNNVNAGFPYYLLMKDYLLLSKKQNPMLACVSPASTISRRFLNQERGARRSGGMSAVHA